MPKQKDIVGLKFSKEELREHVIRNTVGRFEPYKVFLVPGEGKDRTYSIIYDDPRDHSRELVMEQVENKQTANDIRELLERAWALGRISCSAE